MKTKFARFAVAGIFMTIGIVPYLLSMVLNITYMAWNGAKEDCLNILSWIAGE